MLATDTVDCQPTGFRGVKRGNGQKAAEQISGSKYQSQPGHDSAPEARDYCAAFDRSEYQKVVKSSRI